MTPAEIDAAHDEAVMLNRILSGKTVKGDLAAWAAQEMWAARAALNDAPSAPVKDEDQ